MTASNGEPEDHIERLEDAFQRIVQWSEAYAGNMFLGPYMRRAREVLQAAGMTLHAPHQRNLPGLTTLQKAQRTASQCIRIEGGLRHRIETRERQLRLLQRRDRGGVREALDTECENLRRLLLHNSKVLTAALRLAQAINETLPEPVDVDAMLLARLSKLEPRAFV